MCMWDGGRIGHGHLGLVRTQAPLQKSWNRGWTSADHSTKATLMCTVPCSLIKSSTEDLT